MRMRLHLVSVALFLFFAAQAATAATAVPFALTKPLVSQAVASCGDLTMSGGIVDSAPTTGSGDLLANGAVKVSGGTVNGSATAGPGNLVTRTGSGLITGNVSTATSAFSCAQIDLVGLAAILQVSNDNAQIPLTAQRKNPLSSTGDFTLSGGAALRFPPARTSLRSSRSPADQPSRFSDQSTSSRPRT